MPRIPVTDDVVEQLRAVLETGEVEDPVNWMGVQGVALRKGHQELVDFVVEADATTYYEALERARDDAVDPDVGDGGGGAPDSSADATDAG